MHDIYFLSDHHFGHDNILTFTESDEVTKIRPGFNSIEEHDEMLIERHNAMVKPQDHFYAMGDVAINKKYLHLVKRLNGHKRLIMGNHDIFETKAYLQAGFHKICACRVFDGICFTHIPVHAGSIGRWKLNCHGHLHSQVVVDALGAPDPRYLSLCPERIGYTPISLEEIKQKYTHG